MRQDRRAGRVVLGEPVQHVRQGAGVGGGRGRAAQGDHEGGADRGDPGAQPRHFLRGADLCYWTRSGGQLSARLLASLH